jgi:hypothetical protein
MRQRLFFDLNVSWLVFKAASAISDPERLYMYRPIKPNPHHLRNAARVVAIGLVDLRLQHRPHLPRLDTDHRQGCASPSDA